MAHYDPLHPAPHSPNPSTQSFNPESQPLRAPPSPSGQGFYNLRDDGPLPEPRPLGNYGEPEPRNSIVSYGTGSPYRDSAYMPSTPGASTTFLGGAAPAAYDPYSSTAGFNDGNVPMSPMGRSRGMKEEMYAAPAKKKSNFLFRCGIALLIVILLALAVLIPVYFKIVKPKLLSSESGTSGSGSSGSGGSGGSSGGGGGGSSGSQDPITGGDGSTVKLTEGGTMTYVNKFGGYWYEDPSNPFDNSARPQSWTKPLNETWDFSVDKIRG